MNSSQTLLITGASGNLGKRTLEIVRNQFKGHLIATTRNPDKLKSFANAQTEVRAADFDNMASLEAAFKGADRLLLVSTDALGSRVSQHKNAIAAAKKAGVKHIIYTSYPNADKAPAAVAPEHIETEKLIKESGISYTILRNNLYSENLLGPIANAVATGTLIGVAGKGKTSYVSREDCAQAAAGALMSSDNKSEIIDVTGPEALSYDDIAAIASDVTGKKISYQDLPQAEYKSILVKAGVPDVWADVYISFDLTAKENLVSNVTQAVTRFSGKESENLRSFLKRNITALVK